MVFVALYSFTVSKEEIASVISMVLSKLAKKDIERVPSDGVKIKLMQEALVT